MSANHRSKLSLLAVCFVLLGVFSSACQGAPNPQATNPIVNDPDMDINVTPEPTGIQYGYFTVKVERLGVHRTVGWYASGEVYVKTALDLTPDESSDTQLAQGMGFGNAGYDASGGPCINLGGWPVEYSAVGIFDVRDCSLSIRIEETWPYTEAHAVCLGYGGEAGGPPYMIGFPNLKFTPSNPRVETAATVDEIAWTNVFTITRADGFEDVDCDFAVSIGN